MKSDLIKELHDVVFKNTIWPNDLLENLTDPDYLSVNFNTYLDGLCAEVKFVDEGKTIRTNYFFDKKQHIQKVEMIEGERTFVLYDRIEEIAKTFNKAKNVFLC
ncbi:hypothetical protein B7C51_24805 (plasmid) [Paenibacillus larvae subsp. pulvifaciens]|uniref:Uncharacterized protein n=1 Tax=Paenibacillus larvae subsp. pulvifaciens TaxID=1477 RepID=A0A1V0UZU5_9BACL|nr:hypothetical protein [Paenibacillus larvae]ARF70697.1 hypothetical protein B7C51_24805 [Paenibacillus larvae subsp. pulvifaciens]